MTKGKLLELLKPCFDNQEVVVALRSDKHPGGSQLLIQGVVAISPWRPGGKDLIGLVADADNREFDDAEIQLDSFKPVFSLPDHLQHQALDPQWNQAQQVHDWRNYISQRVQDLWHTFTDEQKFALCQQAREDALAEVWD